MPAMMWKEIPVSVFVKGRSLFRLRVSKGAINGGSSIMKSYAFNNGGLKIISHHNNSTIGEIVLLG